MRAADDRVVQLQVAQRTAERQVAS
jgi:hypothetical protein